MYRFIISLLFLLSVIGVQAQSQNDKSEMQKIVQRLDSLEHKLSYIELKDELNQLKSDISIYTNDVRIATLNVSSDFYRRDFDKRLGKSYENLYESFTNRLNSIAELIETKQDLLVTKFIVDHFTATELEYLLSILDHIKNQYTFSKECVEHFKLCVDSYKKFI